LLEKECNPVWWRGDAWFLSNNAAAAIDSKRVLCDWTKEWRVVGLFRVNVIREERWWDSTKREKSVFTLSLCLRDHKTKERTKKWLPSVITIKVNMRSVQVLVVLCFVLFACGEEERKRERVTIPLTHSVKRSLWISIIHRNTTNPTHAKNRSLWRVETLSWTSSTSKRY
jgi:hypothetical protein